MTDDRELSLTLERWLAEGPIQMPDRVLDSVAVGIARQPQRPAWRLQGRPSPVNAYVKIAVAAAAVLLVAVIGYNLLPAGPTTGGQAPTPTATPTGSPVALADGRLAEGSYRIRPIDSVPSLSVVAHVPDGWSGHPENAALTSPNANDNGILISFMTTDGLFSDPCHWDLDGTKTAHTGDIEVGPTVENLVTALKANTAYPSSAATPVRFGPYNGQELELQLPDDNIIRSCDRRPEQQTGDYFVFPDGYYAQGPNSRWHLYIVDVAGTRLITMISIAEGTSPTLIEAAEAIVESFEFTP